MGRTPQLRANASFWLCVCLVLARTFTAAAAPLPSVADQFRNIWHSYQDEQKAFRASNWTTKSGEKTDPVKHTTQHIAKLLVLAESYPKDPSTGDNLLRLSTFSGFQGLDQVETILRRDWPGAGEFWDLQGEYRQAERAYLDMIRLVTTDEDKRKVYEKDHPKTERFTGRFLALAEKHPGSPVAVHTLRWVVLRGRSGSDFDQALQTLRRDHVKADGIEGICEGLGYSTSAHTEGLLRTVAKENPDRVAQGNALLALARVLERQADTVRTLQKSTNYAYPQWMESSYGKERLAAWRKADPSVFEKEAEQLFEQVAERYGDVPTYSGTLGEAANTELFEKRSLAIGKVAPEIEGEDMDGKRFKLSDYRGKVVVIDFWGDW